MFLGIFQDKDSVAKEYQVELDPNVNIIFAQYDYEDYSGSSYVVYEHNGKLYDVNGGHCSCYGLEGQWEPQETSVDAIDKIIKDGHVFNGYRDELQKAMKPWRKK